MRGTRPGVCIALLTAVLLGLVPAHAQIASGTVAFPCSDVPAATYSTALDKPTLPNGLCGYWFPVDSATWGRPFRLHPTTAADFDLYYFNEGGKSLWFYAGGGCGDITGTPLGVPRGATVAVVELNPSSCTSLNASFQYVTS